MKRRNARWTAAAVILAAIGAAGGGGTAAPANAALIDIDPATTYPFADPARELAWYHGQVTPHDTQTRVAAGSTAERSYSQPMGDDPLDFWLAPPAGYDADGDDAHPLVVYLHGAGARGGDVHDNLDSPVPEYWTSQATQALAPGGGAYVLAPKIPYSYQAWVETGVRDNWAIEGYEIDDPDVVSLVDHLVVSRGLRLALTAAAGLVHGGTQDLPTRIDPDRIYIVGQSMGGFGVYDALARVSDAAGRDELADWLALEQAHGGELWPTFTFAAGAAVAGAGPVDRMPELADRPLWMMSHDADPIVPPAATTSLVEAIRDLLDDVDAVHQTAAVTATGATTLGFNSDLAELLAHDRLHTSFTGEGRDGLGPHHWVSQDWPHAGQDDLVARWLFAQSLAAGPLLVGDMNRDGIIDAVDVAPFVLALTDPAGYHAQHGLDPVLVGDINADGTLDAVDVAPFVQLLVGDNATSTPEPGSLVLLGLATLLLTRRRFARVGVTPAATPGSPASA